MHIDLQPQARTPDMIDFGGSGVFNGSIIAVNQQDADICALFLPESVQDVERGS
jgi:hypothetical protein